MTGAKMERNMGVLGITDITDTTDTAMGLAYRHHGGHVSAMASMFYYV